MSLLSKLTKILIISGALAFYWNFGRFLFQTWIQMPRGFEFLSDWAGLFILLSFAYVLAWLIDRRLEDR
jgi:hypothetical protein